MNLEWSDFPKFHVGTCGGGRAGPQHLFNSPHPRLCLQPRGALCKWNRHPRLPLCPTTQAAGLGYPLARDFYTRSAICSPKDRLGDEVCRSPQKCLKTFGHRGEGTAGFQAETSLWLHEFLAPQGRMLLVESQSRTLF